MDSDGPPRVHWQLPPERKDDRGRDGFILLAGLGLLLLWMTIFVVPIFEGGDCLGSDEQCEALWAAQGARIRVYAAILVVNTLVAVLAIAVGRRLLPALLLVVSVVTLALVAASLVMPMDASSHLSRGLILVAPGVLLLAIGAGWRLARGPVV